MMRIYIEEAGPFVPPQPPRPLALSLIIPPFIERELFYEFLRLRDTWPKQSVEVKGSSLDESQAAQLTIRRRVHTARKLERKWP